MMAPSRGVTADELRATPEWERYPNAVVLHTDGADEGVGHGFDNLDPSAYINAYLRTDASWREIVEWYCGRLASLGWELREQLDSLWLAREPGESMVIVDCSQGTGRWITDGSGGWTQNSAAATPGTTFSVYLKRLSSASEV